MKCYYFPKKKCLMKCAPHCDEGWDFVAGGSACVRGFGVGLMVFVVFVLLLYGLHLLVD